MQSDVVFLKSCRTALHHDDIICHWQLENLKAIFHLPHYKFPASVTEGFFSASLLIILIPYARSAYWTCVSVYLWWFNYSGGPSKGGEYHNQLLYVPAHRGTQSWVLGQVWPAVGSIWALICNSRLNPGVHVSEARGGQAAILISSASPRGGEGRNKMETLAPHYSLSWRRSDIGSPPNWPWSLYSAIWVVKTLPRWWWRVEMHHRQIYSMHYIMAI